MDEALSEHIVAASTDQARYNDENRVASSDEGDNESNRRNVEIGTETETSAESVAPDGEQNRVPALQERAPAQPTEANLADPRAGVLHVGCGTYHAEKLPLMFRTDGWREIRLDIDPAVEPDVVASITDMRVISDHAVDAVYSSHNVEHLYAHEVPHALREMARVLKPDGFAFFKLPDLQEVARFIADGKLEDPLYISPMGAIAPLDILYGHRPSLARGNLFMAHRTGFTATTLAVALTAAGFAAVMVQRDVPNLALTAIAFRTLPDAEQISTWQVRMLPAADRPTVLYTLEN